MNSMSDRWCFTVNNPEGWRPIFDGGHMLYLVYQTERGAQGTQHIQGYVRFDTRKRGSTAARIIAGAGNPGHPIHPHVEVARGTEQANKDYCTKADTRIDGPAGEFGEFSPEAGKQGKRSDLELAAERIIGGAAMRDVALEFPSSFIRYHGGFKAFQLTTQPQPPIERNVEVLVLWGPTGTGKTHRIMTMYPDCFCVRPGRDPWDGYCGQETIFLDEFDYTVWNIHEFKLILDKWRYRLQRRYTNDFAAWTRVAICCNACPRSWWSDTPRVSDLDLAAIRRRIEKSCHLVEDRVTPIAEMPVNPDFSTNQ